MELKRWCKNLKLEYWKGVQDYEGIYMVSSLGRVKSLERKVKRGNGFRTIKAKIKKFSIGTNGYLVVNLHKNSKRKVVYVHRLVAIAFIPNPENKPEIDHIDTNRLNNNIKNLRWVTHKENMNNPLSLKKKSEGLKEHYANMSEEERKEIIKKMGEIRKGKKHSKKTREKMSENHADVSGEKHPMWGKHHSEETKKKLSKTHNKRYANMSEEEKKEKYGRKGEKNPNAKKVRCIETGVVFDCIKYASEWCCGDVGKYLRGKSKSANGYHWEYVEEVEIDLNILIDNINISL